MYTTIDWWSIAIQSAIHLSPDLAVRPSQLRQRTSDRCDASATTTRPRVPIATECFACPRFVKRATVLQVTVLSAVVLLNERSNRRNVGGGNIYMRRDGQNKSGKTRRRDLGLVPTASPQLFGEMIFALPCFKHEPSALGKAAFLRGGGNENSPLRLGCITLKYCRTQQSG